jgi:hypothetical protein
MVKETVDDDDNDDDDDDNACGFETLMGLHCVRSRN